MYLFKYSESPEGERSHLPDSDDGIGNKNE